jgi:hypothetical protein
MDVNLLLKNIQSWIINMVMCIIKGNFENEGKVSMLKFYCLKVS